MRIATGGIIHETSTCVDSPTTKQQFEFDRGIIRGADIFERFRGTNVCTGGFIEGAEKCGIELVPLLRASAFPDGLIVREDYDALKREMLDRLAEAERSGGPVDGALLDLHGAMVVDGIDDGDGDVIEAFREYLGPDRPIVVTPPPMDQVLRQVHALEARPGIVCVTIATGFPWANVPEVGGSVMVVADGDEVLAQRTADELGEWIWERRDRWHVPKLPVREALRRGEEAGKFPIIVADHADNTGGGSPGDSTEVLQTFLDLKLQDALILYMVDEAVARQAHAAGVGNRIDISLGGKSSPVQGPPVEAEAEILAISDGPFAYDGPMFAGLTGSMGTSAWLKIDGVNIVVVTAREQPFDMAFVRSLGVDCASMKYVSLKSAAHFRAAFEPIAGSIFNIDAAGIHTHDFSKLPSSRRTRDIFPVEIKPSNAPG